MMNDGFLSQTTRGSLYRAATLSVTLSYENMDFSQRRQHVDLARLIAF